MKPKILLALPLLCLAVFGCKEKTLDAGAGTSPITTTSTAGGTSQTKPAPPPVPEELKSEAFHWYGLGNSKPMKIEISITDQPTMEAEQTVTLVDVKDGKATYEVSRGEKLGTDSVSLEKDGIYTLGSTLITQKIHNLDMPAQVPPGTHWTNTGKVDMHSETRDSSVSQDLVLRVIGVTEVDTKAGKQSALRIRESGSLTVDGVKYRMDSDLYYVKDKGLVKSVAVMRDQSKPKNPAHIVTIQETK
jgi:hypothetical protein